MHDLFDYYKGLHCVVDGQFGSTGKGALAAWLADCSLGSGSERPQWGGTITNSGPNSGHTFYWHDTKHVLKQLPTFSVYHALGGVNIPVYLGPGAIIDPEILVDEAIRYPGLTINVHPLAAVVGQEDKAAEHSGSIQAVAGTRSGTGAVLARKIQRDPNAVFEAHFDQSHFPLNVKKMSFNQWEWVKRDINQRPFFMEVSQGFSLGINQRFYPKCTSRECTVMQGLADAGIPPSFLAKTYMAIRAFPIRVGNVDGFSSGDCYPDQEETTWEKLGVEPELTTVTKRVRRVFTFSNQQFDDAVFANQPDFVFLNFLNYLNADGQRELIERVYRLRSSAEKYFNLILGHGPKVEDVEW